tara:strand:- start:57 stop:1265 length:1209 start_codon:yes stop_codon:yes gene_type:complete
MKHTSQLAGVLLKSNNKEHIPTFERLKQAGFNPKRILDIGAHKAKWTQEASSVFPDAHYILVEPIDFPQLRNYVNKHKNTEVHYEILSDKTAEVDWYELQNSGDSMLKENTRYFMNVEPQKKQAKTLDSLGLAQVDFMKLDVQGAEIKVLEGGRDLVRGATAILLELPFCGEYNENTPSFAAHISYMESINFVPYDICEVHRAHRAITHVDILFVRKDSKLYQKVQSGIESTGTPQQLSKPTALFTVGALQAGCPNFIPLGDVSECPATETELNDLPVCKINKEVELEVDGNSQMVEEDWEVGDLCRATDDNMDDNLRCGAVVMTSGFFDNHNCPQGATKSHSVYKVDSLYVGVDGINTPGVFIVIFYFIVFAALWLGFGLGLRNAGANNLSSSNLNWLLTT